MAHYLMEVGDTPETWRAHLISAAKTDERSRAHVDGALGTTRPTSPAIAYLCMQWFLRERASPCARKSWPPQILVQAKSRSKFAPAQCAGRICTWWTAN